MSYIKRAAQNLLVNKFMTSKSVAITGARQVGKTTHLVVIYLHTDLPYYCSH